MRVLLPSVLAAALLFPQTQAPASQPDSRALQSILEEVQKLRQDLRSTAATIQRAQLLLYRMRLQMDAVSRATQRLEQARAELEQIKAQHNQASTWIRNLEERLDDARDAAERKQFEQAISQAKSWLEQSTAGEPEAQTKEIECASQLHLEEAKLDELQRQFDSLDHKLELAAQATPNR